MDKILPGLKLAQIAWVVKDINVAKSFFEDVLGINSFSEVVTINVKQYEATYYGKPSDAESLVAMAYSGGTFIELIQPTSGESIFRDYLDENPAGGLQHVAFSIPVDEFDKVTSNLTGMGFRDASAFNTPIARIAIFDTSKEIGVMTEIMGITKEGEVQIEKMKS